MLDWSISSRPNAFFAAKSEMDIMSAHLASTEIEDAFIYGTHILCWTFDNRLRIYAVADVEAALHAADRRTAPIVTYALFHARGLGANEQQARAWRQWRRGDDGAPPPVEVDADVVPHHDIAITFDANALLDILVFYDRTYLATTDGLLSLEPFDRANPPSEVRSTVRVSDPCYSASAGLGTVAASCGERGLRLLGAETGWGSLVDVTRQAATTSVRAEVGSATIVNHRSQSDVEFFHGTVDVNAAGRHVMTDVKPATLSVSDQAGGTLHAEAVTYTLWDRGRLLVFSDGRITSVSVHIDDDRRMLRRARDLFHFEQDGLRVLSAQRVGSVYAVETDESILIVGDSVQRLNSGPVLALRTYPRSRRYLRLMTATTARGLSLIAVDDH